jgi:hypothetical protein
VVGPYHRHHHSKRASVDNDLVVGLRHVRISRFRRRAVDRCLDDQGPAYFMVGMLNSAPFLMPDGHRWVTVLTFV